MTTEAPIRVVVGEDQPLFRQGVLHVLEEAGLDVVASAADANDLLRKARAHLPDVAVVDIQMPPHLGDDGLNAACQIRSIKPSIAVLILSQFLEDRYAIQLIGDRPEGVGYLLKDSIADAASFVDAIRRVARGGSAIDAEVVAALVGRRSRRSPLDGLTTREREVLTLMAEGLSNQGIADRLVVTVSAVERHVTTLFAKLGLAQKPAVHRRVLAVLQLLRAEPERLALATGDRRRAAGD
ncbi:MAG TPA: response regulator transcription factor [Solirubrobacteraceae bacterium]|jgi:DNA-binding NarL/FixJ family response regulator|nr:response regulator transcription factor [Solirubrobacteraceae bacterium]